MGTSTFRTAVVRVPNGPDSIEVIDVPVVEPGPGQVRVAVAAATVNPTDLGVAAGFFHSLGLVQQPEHTGLGWEFAGVVDAAGPGVELAVGTRVAGLVVGFDRDYGTYAEQIVVAATDAVPVPEDLDLPAAATVPLNGLAAAQVVDLLGDAPAGAGRLLVTGAAGAVGANVAVLARERGWQVTGLARADDEEFVRGLGAGFTADAESGWDAVVDAAQLNDEAVKLVRDGGSYVGLRPGLAPAAERGISTAALFTVSDSARIADLLARAAAGELPARVHAVVSLDQAADAHRATAKGGLRGRYIIRP
ncbi:alcohol dehydrogenase catalytic domain-containing protein [Streptomyces sp. NPDC058092]|uniref:alcohol dehydrogenase catalytic domain-containing protein n=1 Tax=Streptomyces sp. NPDC058092 TaxID=3346336 RepID=UPI0036EDCBFB